MHLSMLSLRGGAFDFLEEFLVKIPTVGPQNLIPRVVITFFLFLPLFYKAILIRTAELPSFCNVVSSIYLLFVPYFAMAVFVYLPVFTLSYK